MKTIFTDLLGFEVLEEYNFTFKGQYNHIKKGDLLFVFMQTDEFGRTDLLESKGFYVEAHNKDLRNVISYKLVNLAVGAAPSGFLKRLYSD